MICDNCVYPCLCFCTVTELTGKPFFKLRGGGHVHGALAVTIQQGGVSAVAQQQGTDFNTVLWGCLVERGELPQVHGVHTGPMLHREQNKLYERQVLCKVVVTPR